MIILKSKFKRTCVVKGFDMYFFVYTLLYIYGLTVAGNASTVVLYTDLIEMFSSDDNCSSPFAPMNTTNEDSFKQSTPNTELTQHSLRTLSNNNGNDSRCEKIDIDKPRLEDYDWVCYAVKNGSTINTITGSTMSEETNLMLVNCLKGDFLAINCIKYDTMEVITTNICNYGVEMEQRCRQFYMTVDDINILYRCSTSFLVEKELRIKDNKVSDRMSMFDMAAYICAAFILVSFLLSVCIPAQKCKPTYESDKTATPRIPLEIYEMYGAFYKPSAKRQLTSNVEKWNRRMSKLKPHSKNLALVANLRDLERKASKGLNVFDIKKTGKRVTIANAVNVYTMEPDDNDIHDREPIVLDSINLSLYSQTQTDPLHNSGHNGQCITNDKKLPSLLTNAILDKTNPLPVAKKERKFSIC